MTTTTTIPPIYEPPLSAEVIDCAQSIAAESLERNDWGDDWPALYRHVRACMNRTPEPYGGMRAFDDESVSEGIIRAINAR